LHFARDDIALFVWGSAHLTKITAIVPQEWVCGEVAQGMRCGDVCELALPTEYGALPLCEHERRKKKKERTTDE